MIDGERAVTILGVPSQDLPGGESRPERRDAAEHRERILAVARELFDRHGVDSTSMHEIARAAQVGQGTLYRRYAHKGELCGALLKDNWQRFQEDIQDHTSAGHGAQSALAGIEFLLTRLARFNEENAGLLGAMEDAACGPRRGSMYQSPFYGWLRNAAETLLERAVQGGEIAPLDIGCTADAVLAPLSIDLYLYQRRDLGYEPERITASLRRLFFQGLSGGTASGSQDAR